MFVHIPELACNSSRSPPLLTVQIRANAASRCRTIASVQSRSISRKLILPKAMLTSARRATSRALSGRNSSASSRSVISHVVPTNSTRSPDSFKMGPCLRTQSSTVLEATILERSSSCMTYDPHETRASFSDDDACIEPPLPVLNCLFGCAVLQAASGFVLISGNFSRRILISRLFAAYEDLKPLSFERFVVQGCHMSAPGAW